MKNIFLALIVIISCTTRASAFDCRLLKAVTALRPFGSDHLLDSIKLNAAESGRVTAITSGDKVLAHIVRVTDNEIASLEKHGNEVTHDYQELEDHLLDGELSMDETRERWKLSSVTENRMTIDSFVIQMVGHSGAVASLAAFFAGVITFDNSVIFWGATMPFVVGGLGMQGAFAYSSPFRNLYFRWRPFLAERLKEELIRSRLLPELKRTLHDNVAQMTIFVSEAHGDLHSARLLSILRQDPYTKLGPNLQIKDVTVNTLQAPSLEGPAREVTSRDPLYKLFKKYPSSDIARVVSSTMNFLTNRAPSSQRRTAWQRLIDRVKARLGRQAEPALDTDD